VTRLILIDGLSVLYRAFFAIRELRTSDGCPTNAVFGFIRMLKQLREAWKPSHLGVVFDGGACKDRLAVLPEYKKNRPPMPPDLRSQISLAQEFLDLSRIPWVRQESQEADDVVASHAVRASTQFESVLIGTSDKDMFQLVNERVGIVAVSGGNACMGPAEVRVKTGVCPDQIVAWLALVGDSSDNIPGVPGIGPKTAAWLLAEFGDVESLRLRIGEVQKPKIRESLEKNWQTVERNLALVKLRTDLPVAEEWSSWMVTSPSPDRLMPYYMRLEFHALEKELCQSELPGL
jgi:DNA polymerase I